MSNQTFKKCPGEDKEGQRGENVQAYSIISLVCCTATYNMLGTRSCLGENTAPPHADQLLLADQQ